MQYILRKTLLLCVFLCFIYSSEINSTNNPWEAEDYVENALLQLKWAKNFFFDRFTWSGKEHVLDIGSGDGKITHLISKCVPSGYVLGMDNSLSMVNYARQHYSDLPNLAFELADAADLQFYERFESRFDVIVSFHCLHWIENQTNALAGIKKSLKPNGKAFLRLTSKGWDPIQEIADELIHSDKWVSHFTYFKDPVHRYNEFEYQKLIEDAGLRSISIEEVVEDDVLPDEERLSKQIKSWLPHLKHLPPACQKDFLDDLIGVYLARHPPAEDGFIHLYDCYLEAVIGHS